MNKKDLEQGLLPSADPLPSLPVAQPYPTAPYAVVDAIPAVASPYSFVPMSVPGPYASYGRVAVEQERAVVGGDACGGSSFPQFSSNMPLELIGLVDPQYYSEMIAEINDGNRGNFGMVRYVPVLMILSGFLMFAFGSELMVEGQNPALLITGFVFFVLGGFSNVYIKKRQWAQWQRHVTSRCAIASARFPLVRFSLQIRLAVVVYDGALHHQDHHPQQRHRSIYSSTIVVEYPLPPR